MAGECNGALWAPESRDLEPNQRSFSFFPTRRATYSLCSVESQYPLSCSNLLLCWSVGPSFHIPIYVHSTYTCKQVDLHVHTQIQFSSSSFHFSWFRISKNKKKNKKKLRNNPNSNPLIIFSDYYYPY